MNTFSDLTIDESLCAALAARAITAPTAVQSAVIPRVLSGDDIFFRSETGTGKTFCYLLPAFMRLIRSEKKVSPFLLVVAPTHELGAQIKNEAVLLSEGANLPIKAALCIGGAPLKRQIEVLKEKPAILAGGPARLLELIRLKKLHAKDIAMVVLDESDRMLAPELRDILSDLLSVLPASAQYIACSATLSPRHAQLLEKMLPARLDGTKRKIAAVNMPPEDVLKRNITHWAFYSEGRDKIDTLRKFIVAEKPAKALVFTAIAGQVENIAEKLAFRKIPCSALHAKLDKLGRKKAMDDFRSGRTTILVTSDLSARGLDIPGITHVIQLDVNENEDFFIHRAGRTARAGKSGINAIFGDEKELRNLSKIEKKLGIIIYPKVLYGGNVRSPDEDGETDETDTPNPVT